MKRRLLHLFLASVLITLATLPAVAQTKKSSKFARGSMTKAVGTLSSIAVGEKSVTISLAGGETIIAPSGKVRVVDQRGGKRTKAVMSSLAVGQKVIVRTRMSPKGKIRSVKVKITG